MFSPASFAEAERFLILDTDVEHVRSGELTAIEATVTIVDTALSKLTGCKGTMTLGHTDKWVFDQVQCKQFVAAPPMVAHHRYVFSSNSHLDGGTGGAWFRIVVTNSTIALCNLILLKTVSCSPETPLP